MPYSVGTVNPATVWSANYTFTDSKGQVANVSVETPEEITFAEVDALGAAMGAISKCAITAAWRTERKEIVASTASVTDADARIHNKGNFTFANNNLNRTKIAVPGIGQLYVNNNDNILLTHADILAFEVAFLAIKNDGLTGAAVFDLVAGTFNATTRKVRTEKAAPSVTADTADDGGDPNAVTP